MDPASNEDRNTSVISADWGPELARPAPKTGFNPVSTRFQPGFPGRDPKMDLGRSIRTCQILSRSS